MATFSTDLNIYTYTVYMSFTMRSFMKLLSAAICHWYYSYWRNRLIIPPWVGKQGYCDERVCLSVCLSGWLFTRISSKLHVWWACLSVCLSVWLTVHTHIFKTTRQNFTKFLRTLSVALALFFSHNAAIRYVLPVLWITSRFLIMGTWRHNAAAMSCMG